MLLSSYHYHITEKPTDNEDRKKNEILEDLKAKCDEITSLDTSKIKRVKNEILRTKSQLSAAIDVGNISEIRELRQLLETQETSSKELSKKAKLKFENVVHRLTHERFDYFARDRIFLEDLREMVMSVNQDLIDLAFRDRI